MGEEPSICAEGSGRKSRISKHADTIAELRGVKGWGYERIGQHIGMSGNAVSWYCLVNFIERPGPPPPVHSVGPMVVRRGNHDVRRFTADEDTRLLALEAQGLGYSEIGRHMGRKPNSIRGRLATLARRDARAEELGGGQS